jgi:hypothetical protein
MYNDSQVLTQSLGSKGLKKIETGVTARSAPTVIGAAQEILFIDPNRTKKRPFLYP